MQIVTLETENFKRLKAVRIAPDGSLVTICGRNAQGKTSVLDSIMAAIGGAKMAPKDPIRHGEKSAKIKVDLGDYVATRTFTKSGSKIELVGKNGTKLKSPQAILDQLVSSLSFDPLAFSRLSPAQQAEDIRKAVGLDFTDHDAKHASLFEERTGVNREGRALKAKFQALTFHEDAPAEAVVVSELLAKVSELRSENEKRKSKDLALHELRAEAKRVKAQVATHSEELKRIQELLERELTVIADLQDQLLQIKDRGIEARDELDAMPEHDVSELLSQIETAEVTNKAIEQNATFLATRDELRAKQVESEALSGALENLDDQKRKTIASADYPIPGLSVAEDGSGVKYLDVPFEQASGAEQLRVSASIGLALNPKLRVLLIRDGALLDEDSMRLLAELASDNDAQLWVERVGTSDACGVVIEDGEVAS